VELAIYNAKGQLVKTLVAGELEAGRHTAIWNGINANGASVSSGVYFYRLVTSEKTLIRPMVLMK